METSDAEKGTFRHIKQSANVLTIGIDWRKPMGGVAQVLYVYKDLFSPFKFVRTVVAAGNNKFVKGCVFVEALARFVYCLTFDKDIQIVHVHGSTGPSFWRKRIFIKLAKAYGKKVVYHMHGGRFKKFAEKHEESVADTLRHCDCIIALSESWRDYFVSELGCKNVVVIKNVIENPQPSKHKNRLFTLLFLGRLGKNKGIYDLLDVLTENKEEYRGKLKLYFGGDGEVEECKTKIKDGGIEDIAEYQGWVSGEKKIALLNSADAYILPSYNEGLPISILEAMSYSLPIISTRVGGIPEIVEDGTNGYLIKPGDKVDIKTAIDNLMNYESLRIEMGKQSSKKVEHHLPKFVKEQLEELYGSLLKKTIKNKN